MNIEIRKIMIFIYWCFRLLRLRTTYSWNDPRENETLFDLAKQMVYLNHTFISKNLSYFNILDYIFQLFELY